MDIYGTVRKGNNQFIPFLYQGQYVDKETGLANRFRYYDVVAGNYLSQDPIGLGGIVLYGYVGDINNELDPTGEAVQRGKMLNLIINRGQ